MRRASMVSISGMLPFSCPQVGCCKIMEVVKPTFTDPQCFKEITWRHVVTLSEFLLSLNGNQNSLMHISCVRVHLGERPTLNSCALSHWLPPATNDIDSTLLACLYALFYALSSGINTATFPALTWLFTRLPPGSRRIIHHPIGRKWRLMAGRFVWDVWPALRLGVFG